MSVSPGVAALEREVVRIGHAVAHRRRRLGHLIGDVMALAISDRLFLAGEAQALLLAHVARRGPAHQRFHRARRLGLEIERPVLGLGVTRLHGGPGWLVDARCHGKATGWGLCTSV